MTRHEPDPPRKGHLARYARLDGLLDRLPETCKGRTSIWVLQILRIRFDTIETNPFFATLNDVLSVGGYAEHAIRYRRSFLFRGGAACERFFQARLQLHDYKTAGSTSLMMLFVRSKKNSKRTADCR